MSTFSFADNVIQVHDINAINMTVIHHAAKTKGASIFTLDTKVRLLIVQFMYTYNHFCNSRGWKAC